MTRRDMAAIAIVYLNAKNIVFLLMGIYSAPLFLLCCVANVWGLIEMNRLVKEIREAKKEADERKK